MEATPNNKGRTVTKVILIYIIIVLFLIPVIWMVLTSLRPTAELYVQPPMWLPHSLTLDAYRQLFSNNYSMGSVPFSSYLTNSLLASVGGSLLALVFGTLAGYSFARFNFKGKRHMFLSLMLIRAIPGIALGLPLFVLFSRVGIIDTSTALILAYTAVNVPFVTWLMESFFYDIPIEIQEASEVDGCSKWQSFLKINLPLALPGISACGILTFLNCWNEFQIASLVTTTIASKTYPVGVLDFTGEFTIDWHGMAAFASLMIIPAIIVVIVAQKGLIRGLTFGAIK